MEREILYQIDFFGILYCAMRTFNLICRTVNILPVLFDIFNKPKVKVTCTLD